MTIILEDLPRNLRMFLERNNITEARDVVDTSRQQLVDGGCTEHDVEILKAAAAKIVAKKLLSASELLKPPWSQRWSQITYGCAALDECTRGGVITRGITEIFGESGVGKTQILLQLSLTVQLPLELGGLGRGTAYICTEDAFPSKRLHQISEAFAARYPKQDINYMENIYIEHVLDGDDLLKCVSEQLSKLMQNARIGLIVIDSVAAIFRVYSNYIERAREMRRLVNILLHYADKYNCAVICVNQVTTVSSSKRAVPCLGLAWAHLGRTRIKVSKVPREMNVNNTRLTVRKFEVIYSPEAPNGAGEFFITEKGVVDIDHGALSK